MFRVDSVAGKDIETVIGFKYNADGLRTEKTVVTNTYTTSHTVTFVADGTTVKTMTVLHGYTLVAGDYPAVPEKEGYTGEWAEYTSPVRSNVTVQAVYTPITYTVTFVADGETVKTMTVQHGYTLVAGDYPAVPAKEGHTGAWQEYTSPVRGNVTIPAVYTPAFHTVTFVADGVTVKTMTVNRGYTLKILDYPKVPAKLGYSGAWGKYTAPVTQNITVSAIYTAEDPCTVTFLADGEIAQEITVEYGYVLTDEDYPEVPEKDDHIGEWIKYILPVIEDITINAEYSSAFHTVIFMQEDYQDDSQGDLSSNRRIIETITVPDGYILEDGDYPEMPAKPGYSFTWTKYNAPITADITVTGKYESVGSIDPPRPPIEAMSLLDDNSLGAWQPVSTGTLESTVVETHSYVYNGSKLVQETVTTETITDESTTAATEVLYYAYDASGSPLSVTLTDENGTESTYYYVVNIQGDVSAILTTDGSAVVEYTYDAWGNPLSISGSMAATLGELNPLRYRGYIYDQEAEFYYVSSRYYDPEVGRWINADDVLSEVGGDIRGYNSFAYCFNNPVNMSDPNGNWPKWLTGTLNVIGGVTQAAAGAALGAFASWTGVGAVAAGLLVVNGAATVAQGVGQIVNDVAKSNVLREDNVVRTGVREVGRAIGGGVGANIAGAAYDVAVIAASIYAGRVGLQQAGKLPIRVNINDLVNNPLDEFVTIGPADGVISQYCNTIPQSGYGQIFVTKLGDGLYQIANGHHRIAALRLLGYVTVNVFLTK